MNDSVRHDRKKILLKYSDIYIIVFYFLLTFSSLLVIIKKK